MIVGEKVLVIDDDKDFCSLIKMVIKNAGFQVECAFNLAASVPFLSINPPRLVLLDNNLPDGKGIDFFTDHRNLFQTSKVFMISADPTPHLQEIAVRNGIDLFFGKPIDLSEFRQVLKEL